MQALDSELMILDNDIIANNQKIDFYLSGMNQFLQNGYAVDSEFIELTDWWKKKEEKDENGYKKEEANEKIYRKKISFKQDYSTRPLIFFSISKVNDFLFFPKDDAEFQKNVSIYAYIDKLSSSFFTLAVRVKCNEEIFDSPKYNKQPTLQITYVVLNQVKL